MSEPCILVIETSQDVCAAALRSKKGVQVRSQNAARQHARLLLPMIQELIAECNLELNDLDAIAFGRGPGSFTGVRIAVSVAQGLAFGVQCPLIPMSSLEILARSAAVYFGEQAKQSTIMINQDARMGEVYAAAYRWEGSSTHAVIEDCLLSPESLIRRVIESEAAAKEETKDKTSAWLFAGDALPQLSLAAQSLGHADLAARWSDENCSHAQVEANAHCAMDIAEAIWQKDGAIPAEQAAPVYLRGADAWKKSAG